MTDIIGTFSTGVSTNFGAGVSVDTSFSGPGVSLDSLLGTIKLFEFYNPFAFVSFDHNPNKFEVSRETLERPRASTAEGSGGSAATDNKTYPTKVVFNALLTEEDPGDALGAAVDVLTGQSVVSRATTLMNWSTIGGDQSAIARLASSAAKKLMSLPGSVLGITPQEGLSRPLLMLQWGDPLRGHLMLGMLKTVTVSYKRFSATGNPTRAEVNCTFLEKKNKYLSMLTNPTSGGVSGRRAHTMTEGENLIGVATQNYGRPGAWRALADSNGIDDPMRVRPGHRLLVPPDESAEG